MKRKGHGMKDARSFARAGVAAATLALASSAVADPLLDAGEGYTGQIRLAADLDDARGYCLDVPGSHTNLLFHIPVWAHTCHSTALPDQNFRYNEGGSGAFRFVTEEHDLCLTANEASEGSQFSYEVCDTPERQTFDVSAEGVFTLRGSDLCLAVSNMTEGGSQDEPGVGRQVQASHMVRMLRLRPCGQGAPEMDRWVARQQ